MGVFKLGKMTIGSLFKQPETTKYPFEKKPQPAGLKGHIAVDAGTCILCGMCERSCSTDCIHVDKAARTWAIERFQCVQCGYCIRVCPKQSLSMLPDYPAPSTQKGMDVVEIPDQAPKAKGEPAKDGEEAKPVAASPVKAESGATAAAETAVKVSKTPEPEDQVEAETGEVALDGELEAKLALMDAAKAKAVREALAAR